MLCCKEIIDGHLENERVAFRLDERRRLDENAIPTKCPDRAEHGNPARRRADPQAGGSCQKGDSSDVAERHDARSTPHGAVGQHRTVGSDR